MVTMIRIRHLRSRANRRMLAAKPPGLSIRGVIDSVIGESCGVRQNNQGNRFVATAGHAPTPCYSAVQPGASLRSPIAETLASMEVHCEFFTRPARRRGLPDAG